MTQTEMVAIRFPRALREALDALAVADRRNFSEYVRIVLEDHVTEKKKGGRR